MWQLMTELWRDDRGCVPVTEWMLVASILSLGYVAVMLAMHTP